jgi:catechol 2,3-dioxygenase-like lactoylglutathione lyase family enzyme
MAISRIASITVPVTDHNRSVGLYRDVLGFAVIRDQTTTERGREIHMTAPGGGAAIILVPASDQHRAGSTHGGALQVRDMLDAVERLAVGGIDVTITVRHLDSEAGVWAEFADHDGNAWLLWQPAERPAPELIAA